jgi:hypothetical protein
MPLKNGIEMFEEIELTSHLEKYPLLYFLPRLLKKDINDDISGRG